jgi:hypothetical protein
MGNYYYLCLKCIVLDEYIPFIQKGYLKDDISEEEYNLLPSSYKYMIDIWSNLKLIRNIQEYELVGSEFTMHISKKDRVECFNIEGDYLTFLKDIIVNITSEITECSLSNDYFPIERHYSDSQLRDISFILKDKIKYIEHVYNEDKTEILETHVYYKYPIKKKQFLDLNNAYTK